jgi:hypothetical protein
MIPDLDVFDPADFDAYLADLKLVDLHAYQATLDDLDAAPAFFGHAPVPVTL